MKNTFITKDKAINKEFIKLLYKIYQEELRLLVLTYTAPNGKERIYTIYDNCVHRLLFDKLYDPTVHWTLVKNTADPKILLYMKCSSEPIIYDVRTIEE